MRTVPILPAQLAGHSVHGRVLGPSPSWVTKKESGEVITASPFLAYIIDKYSAMFNVYILHSSSIDKYYVGYTNDLARRLLEHNRKKGKYTDGGIPWCLVHQEEYALKSDAMNREKQIKQHKSRQYILSILSI